MTFEEAKKLLDASIREELRDHAFGDVEVGWVDAQGKEVAGGYFGSTQEVWIIDPQDFNKTYAGFTGDEARSLRKCGKLGKVERNDETGPDTFKEGECLPSLTLEGVRKELMGE